MSKKVSNYLNKKDRHQYNDLDKILSYYVSGGFSRFLTDNNAMNIEFHPTIKRNKNSLIVEFDYHNLYTKVEFNENGYKYTKYESNNTVYKRKLGSENGSYNLGFNVIVLLENIIDSLKSEASFSSDVTPIIKSKVTHNSNPIIKVVLIMLVPYLLFVVMSAGLLRITNAPYVVMATFFPFLLIPLGFIIMILIIIAIASKKK